METYAVQFAEGAEEYYLDSYGNGYFLEDADVKIGDISICWIRQGDRVQMSVVLEGYLGEQGLCAEVSILQIGPSLLADRIELEMNTFVLVLSTKWNKGRRAVEQFLNQKLREVSRLAYHKDVYEQRQIWGMYHEQEVLRFNPHGQEKNVPGRLSEN